MALRLSKSTFVLESMAAIEYGDDESTNDCGLDAEALEIVSNVTKSLHHAKDFFNSLRLHAPSSIHFSHDTFQATEDANAVKRAMLVLDAIRPAREASHDVWLCISEQFAAYESQINALKLRSGFLALPDEVLSEVLKFASYQKDAIKSTVNAATRLSHVCSRFRTLIISAFDLWNRVSPSMRMDAISSCFSRCGPAGVEIFGSTCSFQGDLLPFVERVTNKVHVWRRFEYCCGGSELSVRRFLNLDTLRLTTIAAPLLSELKIGYPYAALKDVVRNGVNRDALHFYSSWSLPMLYTMIATNFVPIPFPGSNSLVSLVIDLDFMYHKKERAGPFDAMALATFLSSCPVIQEFSLTICECRKFVAPPRDERVVMTGVGKLRFNFYYCNNFVVKSLFDIVRFPDVHWMRLECDSREKDVESDAQCQKIIQAVLPDSNAFPKLGHLELEIRAEGLYDPEAKTFAPNKPLSIPFTSVPNLRSLALTTWATLLEPVPEGPILPKLNSLALVNCWLMDFGWFSEIYGRICTRHDFAASPSDVTVSGCPWEDVVNQMFQRRLSPVNIKEVDGPECQTEIRHDGAAYDILIRKPIFVLQPL